MLKMNVLDLMCFIQNAEQGILISDEKGQDTIYSQDEFIDWVISNENELSIYYIDSSEKIVQINMGTCEYIVSML